MAVQIHPGDDPADHYRSGADAVRTAEQDAGCGVGRVAGAGRG